MVRLALVQAANHTGADLVVGSWIYILIPTLLAVLAGIYVGHKCRVKSVFKLTVLLATGVMLLGSFLFFLVYR